MSVSVTWKTTDVIEWLEKNNFGSYSPKFVEQKIDGITLLSLTEVDLTQYLGFKVLGDIRRFVSCIDDLKRAHSPPVSPTVKIVDFFGKPQSRPSSPLDDTPTLERVRSHDALDTRKSSNSNASARANSWSTRKDFKVLIPELGWWENPDAESWSSSLTKLFVSFAFLGFSIFMTAMVMTIVHERTPDPTIYLPLPDFILDNIERIPIAFKLAEVCATILSVILASVLLFHQHRMIIGRRICAIIGTVFLLRCATMFITSLSVPGKHLTNCAKTMQKNTSYEEKLATAWNITKGFGMSIAGVHTCGDYMFSGHTSMLSLLNYFIIEYTPMHWKGLHIITCVLNLFGMFFILAAHEHYSIDVLIAFFVCDRIFNHYHTMANIHFTVWTTSGANLLRDNAIFPLLAYLEEHSKGVIPNEFGIPLLTWYQKQRQSPQEHSREQELLTK
jgi:hypothetical protein